MTSVNESAPVVWKAEVRVGAPPDLVWGLIADIDRWPQWNPDIKSATLRGPLAPGTMFRWKAGPSTITSTLRRVEAPSVIGWTGSTMGIRAVHIWRIHGEDHGALVQSEESWDGLLPRLLKGMMRRTLRSSIHKTLGHLKGEAERRAASA